MVATELAPYANILCFTVLNGASSVATFLLNDKRRAEKLPY